MQEAAGTDWTHYIAIYGALLATAVAVYNGVSEWRARRPNVKVKVSLGLLTFPAGPSDAMIIIEASNPGHKAVTLSSVGFLLPTIGKVFIPGARGDVTLPCELSPESGCRVWIEARECTTRLRQMGLSGEVRIIGFYYDQVGRTYKSKPFKFDVDEWT